MFQKTSETAPTLYNDANLQRELKNYDYALQLYDQALKLDPNHYPSLCAAGQILAGKGDFDACEKVLTKATSLSSSDATAYLPLIALARLSKSRDWAKQLGKGINKLTIPLEDKKRLRMQIKGTPSKADWAYAKAAYEVAGQAAAQNDTLGCIMALLDAIRLGPDNPEAIQNLTVSLGSIGRWDEAKNIARNFCDAYPRKAIYWRLLINIAQQQQDSALATECYEVLLRLEPKNPVIPCELALAKMNTGDDASAKQHLQTVEKQGYDGVEYILAKVNYLILTGEKDHARNLAETAINRFPDNIQLLAKYAELTKTAFDSDLFARLQDALEKPSTAPMERAMMLRILANGYESAKQYENAFNAYTQSNQIIWENTDNRAEIEQNAAQLWQEFYDVPNWPAALKGADTLTPLFIFGMPRSGTTLTEQIIASHSQVTSIGESSILNESCKDFFAKHSIKTIADLDVQQLGKLRDIIIEKFQNMAEGRPYITDKTLPSYFTMPVAKLLFPNAAFIHVHRDPRDNLWSIFKNRFSGNEHLYSYDQLALGQHYNRYRDFMTYLRKGFDGDFLDQRYEDLIAEQEQQSRALIAHCGLDWEDACLEFYNNKNTVRTLSMIQVRQPIYSTSVQVWRHYEAQLQPMFDCLKEAGYYPSDD